MVALIHRFAAHDSQTHPWGPLGLWANGAHGPMAQEAHGHPPVFVTTTHVVALSWLDWLGYDAMIPGAHHKHEWEPVCT